jgi:hypothetical protein
MSPLREAAPGVTSSEDKRERRRLRFSKQAIRVELCAFDRVDRVLYRHPLAESSAQREHREPSIEAAPELRRPSLDDLLALSLDDRILHHHEPSFGHAFSQIGTTVVVIVSILIVQIQ